MNAAKAIEICYARTLRKYAELGEGVKLRPWQSLREDEWRYTNDEGDKRFPCIDIRCSPPASREDIGVCFDAQCYMTCAHKVADDRDHEKVSAMFEETERVTLLLFKQWRNQTLTEDQIAYWREQWTNLLGATYILPAFTVGDPVPPTDENNLSVIGVSQIVSFPRTDI